MGWTVFASTRRADAAATTRPYLDLAADPATWRLPRVAAAFLCGAVTSLETCRRDPELTHRVNVTGTLALARRLLDNGTWVAFLSTNLVFDGRTPQARPDDPVAPRTNYGRQKAEVEQCLLAGGGPVLVARLTKVVPPDLPLLQGWIEALGAGRPIQPFSDYVMAPIGHDWTVEVLAQAARQRATGIVQLSSRQDVRYDEVGRHLARRVGAAEALVQPVTSREAGLTPEHIPLHTTLSTERLEAEFGRTPPDAWSVIDQAIQQ